MSALALSGSAIYSARVSSPSTSHIINRRVASKATPPHTRLHVVIASLLLAALTLALTFGLGAKPASANWFSDAVSNTFCTDRNFFNKPTSTDGGFQGLLFSGRKDLPNEKYAGTQLTVYAGENDLHYYERDGKPTEESDVRWSSSCVPVMEIITTTLGNLLLNLTSTLTIIAAWLLEQAFQPEWIGTLSDGVISMIEGSSGSGGLRDSLYLPFFGLMMILVALWLVKEALVKQRILSSVHGILHMLAVAVLGGVMMFNSQLVPSVIEDVTSSFGAATLTLTAEDKDGMCVMPDDATYAATDKAGRETERTLRVLSCNYWRAFVYQNWTAAQFGQGDMDDLAMQQLKATSIVNDVKPTEASWYALVDSVAKNQSPSTFSTWAGSNMMIRFTVPLVGTVSSIAGLAISTVLGFSLLIAQLMVVIALVFSPVVLLIGLHPGAGKRVMMKWGEFLAANIIKQLMLSVMLGIMVVMFSTVTTIGLSWQLQILALLVISFALLKFRHEMTGWVTSGVDLSRGIEQRAGNAVKSGASTVGSSVGAVGMARNDLRAAPGAMAKLKVAQTAMSTAARSGSARVGAGAAGVVADRAVREQERADAQVATQQREREEERELVRERTRREEAQETPQKRAQAAAERRDDQEQEMLMRMASQRASEPQPKPQPQAAPMATTATKQPQPESQERPQASTQPATQAATQPAAQAATEKVTTAQSQPLPKPKQQEPQQPQENRKGRSRKPGPLPPPPASTATPATAQASTSKVESARTKK